MKRVLLKISGESLCGEAGSIDSGSVEAIADLIHQVITSGREVAIVFGGGNIYRGSKLIAAGMNPADSHNMSMLSTIFNAVSVKNFLEKKEILVHVLDALGVEFLERYTSIAARRYLDDGRVVICTSGTGAPFFTTDTGGVLRALELGCEAVVKLTKVDGVYDSDPMTNPGAQKLEHITYAACLEKNLKILDTTAVVMARDNSLPIYVSRLDDAESLISILDGKEGGSKIS